MLGLWAGLKSILEGKNAPKNRKTLAISTGVYGRGIGEMAEACGADVEFIEFDYDCVVDERTVGQITREIAALKPDLVTMVHCDTPSGTLNGCLREIGAAVKAANADALFYVDFVSSAGGAPVAVDEWRIDIGLWGTQKALSCAPSMTIVTVSEAAWRRIDACGYVGYDALLALERAVDALLDEGLAAVYTRHRTNAAHCVARLQALGVRVHARRIAAVSPTVVAFYVPDGWTFGEFDAKLRSTGVVLGGSYGKLEGKVARIGVMG
jgi:aspartate aminotransferase-like enzyme